MYPEVEPPKRRASPDAGCVRWAYVGPSERAFAVGQLDERRAIPGAWVLREPQSNRCGGATSKTTALASGPICLQLSSSCRKCF